MAPCGCLAPDSSGSGGTTGVGLVHCGGFRSLLDSDRGCCPSQYCLAVIPSQVRRRSHPRPFPSTGSGISRTISWAALRSGGDQEALWVIESVGTYGARLARDATRAGYGAVETPRMSARARHGIGKSDPLDTAAIARDVLGLDETPLRQPRRDKGVRAALRTLTAARDQLTRKRTLNVNALAALLRVNDLGIDARKPLTTTQILTVTRWRERKDHRRGNTPLETIFTNFTSCAVCQQVIDALFRELSISLTPPIPDSVLELISLDFLRVCDHAERTHKWNSVPPPRSETCLTPWSWPSDSG